MITSPATCVHVASHFHAKFGLILCEGILFSSCPEIYCRDKSLYCRLITNLLFLSTNEVIPMPAAKTTDSSTASSTTSIAADGTSE